MIVLILDVSRFDVSLKKYKNKLYCVLPFFVSAFIT